MNCVGTLIAQNQMILFFFSYFDVQTARQIMGCIKWSRFSLWRISVHNWRKCVAYKPPHLRFTPPHRLVIMYINQSVIPNCIQVYHDKSTCINVSQNQAILSDMLLPTPTSSTQIALNQICCPLQLCTTTHPIPMVPPTPSPWYHPPGGTPSPWCHPPCPHGATHAVPMVPPTHPHGATHPSP